MSLDDNMSRVLERRQQIETQLADSASLNAEKLADLSRELSELRPVAEQVELVQHLKQNLSDAKEIIASDDDAEMTEMAELECQSLIPQIEEAENHLKILLLPKDKDDNRNAILEVRAGTGGEEAALFAADLFGMYQRVAGRFGWRFEVMEISETGIGGYKEATANISGQDVFAKLKFESGVHRVQRVPETETGGRIHTSAATVAVLPEAQDVDIEVVETDLRIDVFRASGPGAVCEYNRLSCAYYASAYRHCGQSAG